MPTKRCKPSLLLLCLTTFLLSGCASKFPNPQNSPAKPSVSLEGPAVFSATLAAHGGDKLHELNNVSVGITGKWKQLIRRIQPLVTDFKYRVDSQERLFPKERIYASEYRGPAGTKSVFRSPNEIAVHYNGKVSQDPETLSSTALTADAFHLFLLGPLALEPWQHQFVRLSDQTLNGMQHQRIHLLRQPGFGLGAADEIVLWVNEKTRLTSMVQITLTGHESTKAAHVEVEYLEFRSKGAYTFPVKFFERVNAPIAIDAHAWELTGLAINLDYTTDDLRKPGFSGSAAGIVAF